MCCIPDLWWTPRSCLSLYFRKFYREMLRKSRINWYTVYIDEAGFNLTKARRRGRNIIGHGAIINVPGQRGGNITLCPAITQNGVLLCHASMGPYNTPHILTFLDRLHNIVTAVNHRPQMQYIVIGTMCHSTALLWSRTGFNTIHSLQYYSFHQSLCF